jgi:hypothetical protein
MTDAEKPRGGGSRGAEGSVDCGSIPSDNNPNLDAAQDPSWRDVLPVHPAADLFSLMSREELLELGEDIKKNGLKMPIVLIAGPDGLMLLDGRNRLAAMEVVGLPVYRNITPRTVLAHDADAYAYVLSANVHRRHLTAEQRRDLIAKLLLAQPEKSDRQIAKQVNRDHKTSPPFGRRRRTWGTFPTSRSVPTPRGASSRPPSRRLTPSPPQARRPCAPRCSPTCPRPSAIG